MASAQPEGAQAPTVFHESAASILATEHWSVLGSRSLSYNETFSRTGVYLNVLSAAVVALALVADATGFGEGFTWFALVLFPLVFFLGTATYVRLVQLNVDDVLQAIAMNRLRRAYLDLAPELAPYFTASAYDDFAGIMQTLMWDTNRGIRPALHMLVTTPTVVMTIDAIVAGAGAALLLARVGGSPAAVLGAGTGVFAVVWLVLLGYQARTVTYLRSLQPRFPTPAPD